jgi:hypothetical protein
MSDIGIAAQRGVKSTVAWVTDGTLSPVGHFRAGADLPEHWVRRLTVRTDDGGRLDLDFIALNPSALDFGPWTPPPEREAAPLEPVTLAAE